MRFLIPFLLLVARLAAEPLALGAGESLGYHVGWGLFFHAGDINISAAVASAATPQLCVTTTTATRGIARAIYAFNARADALFDAKSGRLVSTTETSKSPAKETKTTVTFDYARATASYVNAFDSTRDTTLALPPGDPSDLIMSLVRTRTWNLKPGEMRDALVLFDDEFYELTIHATGYEEVHTPLGTFNTLVLEPRMEKTPPKGMFKRGSEVKVWISQDERHLPVRFQVEFRFGAGVATLARYQPPTAAVADTKPDAKDSRS